MADARQVLIREIKNENPLYVNRIINDFKDQVIREHEHNEDDQNATEYFKAIIEWTKMRARVSHADQLDYLQAGAKLEEVVELIEKNNEEQE